MSPLTVFLRTLMKSSAIFLGAGLIFLNPSLEMSGTRGVTAQKSPAEGAVDALTSALKDSDAGVRKQAAHALGQMRSARAVPALIDALRDENPEVRAQAMWALAETRDRRATTAITAALKDTDATVRARAASALAEIRDPASVEGLIAAVRDTNVTVRKNVVRALGELRDSRALPALTQALKDEDAAIRRSAIVAIAEISGEGPEPEHLGARHLSRLNPHPHPMPHRVITRPIALNSARIAADVARAVRTRTSVRVHTTIGDR